MKLNIMENEKINYGFFTKIINNNRCERANILNGKIEVKDRGEGTKVICLRKKITAKAFGKTILVYNGKKFLPINVTTLKVGMRYKSLVLTKRYGVDIHKKKKRNNNE